MGHWAYLEAKDKYGVAVGGLHELDAVFADDGEDREEAGEAEQVANLFAEVDEFEAAACGLGRDIKADESADAHAVGVLDIGEIEDDAFGGGNQVDDGGG